MNNFDFRLLAVTCLLSLASFTTIAGDITPTATVKPAGALEAKLTANKVTRNADNKEVLLPADKVVPDDLLEYQVVYQNNGKSLLKQFTASLPIPVGTTYVTGSAKPAGAMASLDGKNFAAMPLKRMVKKPDGKFEEQLVPLVEYRALKWKLAELAEKNKAQISARVRVNQVAVSSTAIK